MLNLKKLALILLVAFTLIAASVALAYDSGWDDRFDGAGEGTWEVTSYSQGTQAACDTLAGEVCMEWCVQAPSGNIIATGDLCCVVNGVCVRAR